MRCGIEFEYLIIDLGGAEPGRIRDFGNLPYAVIAPLLEDKPGRDDTSLATGDLGIRSGYWYLEGDERFHEDGRFRTLMVKGIEIRTPPARDVDRAIRALVDIEAQLAAVLAEQGFGLAIAGFNPVRPRYDFDPPLNAWERAERRRDRGYDGSHISTLSYGPDINLSMPGWTPAQSLDAARKLNAYAPLIVPFSFSSPFYAGQVWSGLSKRTYERAALRPAVKLYVDPRNAADAAARSRLTSAARLPEEIGRIEFKAFDAMPSLDLLQACCCLLEGICRAPDLPARSESIDLDTYRRGALQGFDDDAIRDACADILGRSRRALHDIGKHREAESLDRLDESLRRRRTPAHQLRSRFRVTGRMVHPGGLQTRRPEYPDEAHGPDDTPPLGPDRDGDGRPARALGSRGRSGG